MEITISISLKSRKEEVISGVDVAVCELLVSRGLYVDYSIKSNCTENAVRCSDVSLKNEIEEIVSRICK